MAGRLLVILALVAGCGPVRYVGQVGRASDAVEAARVARAETFAPYWYTLATQYLHKAREVAAHADFEGANRFGKLSAEAATKAADEARIAEKDPQQRPLDIPTNIAPAKDREPPPAPVAPAKPVPAKDAP